MTDEYDFAQRGIDKYVDAYLDSLSDLTGRVVVDIPSGDGRASHGFARKGATVRAFDLYPEFMRVRGVQAQFADLTGTLPIEDASADYVICQEGIEHVEEQLGVLTEFNRVLKPGGTLVVTTPSMSHARARLSMYLLETDLWKRMPPTELDAIWISEKQSDRLYFGHLFLVGAQHLQTLARLAGFEVVERRRTDVGATSVVLTLLTYPFLVIATLASYAIYGRKLPHVDAPTRKRILWQRVKLNLSWKTLTCKHIFWVLRKSQEIPEVIAELKELTRGDAESSSSSA